MDEPITKEEPSTCSLCGQPAYLIRFCGTLYCKDHNQDCCLTRITQDDKDDNDDTTSTTSFTWMGAI